MGLIDRIALGETNWCKTPESRLGWIISCVIIPLIICLVYGIKYCTNTWEGIGMGIILALITFPAMGLIGAIVVFVCQIIYWIKTGNFPLSGST